MSERRSGEKPSSFTVACSRLSQYLRENRGLADLGLGVGPRQQEPAQGVFPPPTTMSLLPGVDVSADNQTGTKGNVSDGNATKSMDLFPRHSSFIPAGPADDDAGKRPETKEPEKAQLTVFYEGKVLVFDNFPADKAKDLMQLASQRCSAARSFIPATPSSAASTVANHDRPPRLAQPGASDLPIARRASLNRFLEKRKDRINSKVPYQVNGSPMVAPAKLEVTQPWLSMGQKVFEASPELPEQ